jgi:hypothetical protein
MKTVRRRAILAIACGACLLVLAVACTFAALSAKPQPAGPVSISFQGWTNSNAVTQALFRFTNRGAAKCYCDGDLEATELRDGGSKFTGSFACVLKGHSGCTEPLAVSTSTNSWRVSAAIYARVPRPSWQRGMVSHLDGVGVHIHGGGKYGPIRISFGGSFGSGLVPDVIYPFTNSWIITNSLASR